MVIRGVNNLIVRDLSEESPEGDGGREDGELHEEEGREALKVESRLVECIGGCALERFYVTLHVKTENLGSGLYQCKISH